MYVESCIFELTKELFIVNLEDKRIIRKITTSKLYNSELEGLCVYDDEKNIISIALVGILLIVKDIIKLFG